MRYIDNSVVRPPDGWKARADAASAAVARGDQIDNYRAVWRELKDMLADLLHDKCWYCETPVERSDNAVDHFRPKNRVKDAEREHTGYRWLAFDLTNYRYACTFCNSRRKDVDGGTAGGKSDRFPLVDEGARLYGPGPLAQECPALLDPCDVADHLLLGCRQEDGRPCSTSSDILNKMRAELSIEIYHLHHEPTCKRRHGEVVKFVADVDEAKRQFVLSATDNTRKQDFCVVAKRILTAIQPRSPFSGDLRFVLRGARSEDQPWIQQLLET